MTDFSPTKSFDKFRSLFRDASSSIKNNFINEVFNKTHFDEITTNLNKINNKNNNNVQIDVREEKRLYV